MLRVGQVLSRLSLKKNSFVFVSIQNKCEGKDAIDFTTIGVLESDAQCSPNSVVTTLNKIIANKDNGEKAVINISTLASSSYPAGGQLLNWNFQLHHSSFHLYLAHIIYYFLVLATSGPIKGKYLFFKFRDLSIDYLKKCSSVLGQSYVPTEYEALISDKLSPDVMISGNPFEAFRKGCTTVCKGKTVGI